MRFGILTISDRSYRGERDDLSGPALARALLDAGVPDPVAALVPDERDQIAAQLIDWSDRLQLDVVLTTGGTGFAPRDVTPEATLQVADRLAPGLAEAIRAESLKVTPHAMLSRGIAAIRGQTLIVNLPGSPRGAVESLAVILPVLPHAVELLHADPAADQHHR